MYGILLRIRKYYYAHQAAYGTVAKGGGSLAKDVHCATQPIKPVQVQQQGPSAHNGRRPQGTHDKQPTSLMYVWLIITTPFDHPGVVVVTHMWLMCDSCLTHVWLIMTTVQAYTIWPPRCCLLWQHIFLLEQPMLVIHDARVASGSCGGDVGMSTIFSPVIYYHRSSSSSSKGVQE